MSRFCRWVIYINRSNQSSCLPCNAIRKLTYQSAVTLLVHCASKEDKKKRTIEFPDSSLLSHEQLIKQACTATVNSTCQLLTSTLVALVDTGQKYIKALEDQLSLLEESIMHVSDEVLQDDLTDLTTAVRYSVNKFRKNYMELDSLMEYVVKVVVSATETSYLAGAETACNALSERLHSAQTVIEEQKRQIKRLEEELVHLQQEVIRRSGNSDSNNNQKPSP